MDVSDYRSLPSPSRSALRSSCSPPRSKELRVTFHQESLDEPLKSKLFSGALNDIASRALRRTSQEPLLTPTERKCEVESSYLDSVLAEYITSLSPDQALDTQNFTDACWPELKPLVTSLTWPLAQKGTELESHAERLLQLSSGTRTRVSNLDLESSFWSWILKSLVINYSVTECNSFTSWPNHQAHCEHGQGLGF